MQRLRALGGEPLSLEQVMAQSDVIIATTGVRGLIKPEWVRKGQIIFALSNPDSEIEPVLALERGAVFAADGKSINNVSGFPGAFQGCTGGPRHALHGRHADGSRPGARAYRAPRRTIARPA